MPKIDFDDYKKSSEFFEGRSSSIHQINNTNKQFYIEEENILFDLIEVGIGKKMGVELVEVWISYVGKDFKIRCDVLSKKELNALDLNDYLFFMMEEYKTCLDCKQKFLNGFCDEQNRKDEEKENDDEL